MQSVRYFTSSRSATLLLAISSAVLAGCLILFPREAFQASLAGLKLWWELVFPALLPFLIVAEMLAGLGALHAFGVLTNPFMRSWLHLPRESGAAMAFGLIAGYPVGAEMTAKLYRERLIRSEDAATLLAVTHLCSPVVLIGLVGAGFLQDARLGLLVAAVHYLSAMIACLMLGVLWNKPTKNNLSPLSNRMVHEETPMHGNGNSHHRLGLWAEAIQTMRKARSTDGRTFGKLLGDAVAGSVQRLMLIGGFIMMFTVFHHMLSLFLPMTGIPVSLQPWLAGLLEPHLGAHTGSQLTGIHPVWKTAGIGAILAWSGLSIHAQVQNIISGTEIRYGPFLRFRCLHAALAFGVTMLLWHPFHNWFIKPVPSFLVITDRTLSTERIAAPLSSLWGSEPLFMSLLLLLLVMGIMVVCSLIITRHSNRSDINGGKS